MKIGPFFYVKDALIFNACSLSEGRKQADKLDNSYGHEKLWDDHFHTGDYIDYPRGRVVWDCTNQRAIVYIDPCIKKAHVLEKIRIAFDLTDYILAEEDHYHCQKCTGSLFQD